MPSSRTRLPEGAYGLKIVSAQAVPVAKQNQHYRIDLMLMVLQPMEFATRYLHFAVGYSPFDQRYLQDIFEACGCPEVGEATPHNVGRLVPEGLVAELAYEKLSYVGTDIEVPVVRPLICGPDRVYKDPRIARLEWAQAVKDAVVEEERPEAEERIKTLELEAGLFCSCEEPAIERRAFDSFAYDFCGACKKEVRQ